MAVQIPTKKAALKHVAGVLVGEINTGNIVEMAGLDESTLTKAEMARLDWALKEISGRLVKIGGVETEE